MAYTKNYDKTAYIEKQNQDKLEIENARKEFLQSKTLKEILSIICEMKHIYSFYNSLSLSMQGMYRRLNGEKCQGIFNSYLNWKKKDEKGNFYQVRKGETGYKVLVPTPYKKEKVNAETNEKEIHKILFFKIGSTFDIYQVDYLNSKGELIESGKDIVSRMEKEENEKIYKRGNSDIEYNTLKSFIYKLFPKIKIIEDNTNTNDRGYYSMLDSTITICNGNSYTLLHEVGHYIAHTSGADNRKSGEIVNENTTEYAKGEILAEIGACLLLKKYDDSIKYNYNYANVWNSKVNHNFTEHEFSKCFNAIKNMIFAENDNTEIE